MMKCYTKIKKILTHVKSGLGSLLLSCALLLTSWGAVAQQNVGKFTFRYTDTPLLEVLRDINQRTGNQVMFKVEEIEKENSPVSINLQNVSVIEGIRSLIRGKNLTVVERNGQIIISPQAQPQLTNPIVSIVTLRGTVQTKNGTPIIGATIQVKGTQTGFITDVNGQFNHRLQNPPSPIVLDVRYMGMESVEVQYQEGKLIVMIEAIAKVDEVVITGMFDKPKAGYTGAVTFIGKDELNTSSSVNILQAIQNLDPGFYMAENLMDGANPNTLPDITIRGSSSFDAAVIREMQDDLNSSPNQPLFILDGFEVSLRKIMDLDRNIIENVTIHKDASSAALYGTRGANGVVVFTTSKPKTGQLRFNYSGSVNIQVPDLRSYNLMNSREKLAFEKASGLYDYPRASKHNDLDNLYNQRLLDVARGVDTYWLKYPSRVGVGQHHSINIEGGREEITYSANLSYGNTVGVMKGSERENINGDLFLGYNYNKIRFQNTLSVGFNNSTESPYGAFSDYTKANSYFKPYDDDGNPIKMLEKNQYYNSISSISRSFGNPLWNAIQPYRNDSKYTEIKNNFSVIWDVIPNDMRIEGKVGYTHTNNRADRYVSPTNTKYDTYADTSAKGEYRYGSGEKNHLNAALSLAYGKLFAEKHLFNAGISLDYGSENSEYYSFDAEGVTKPEMAFIGATAQYKEGGAPNWDESSSRRIGAVLTANYIYDHRYFVDFSVTAEGSSKFGANKRFAPFGSIGAGWNIHPEKFMENVKAISIARIRFSVGTTGILNFPSYQAIPTYRPYSSSNYGGWHGVRLEGMGNPDLGWQKTTFFNAGFDLEMFDRRLLLTGDIYSKETTDVLADVTIPSASGFTKYRANVGKLKNNGIELKATGYIIRNREKGWIWSVTGSVAHNKNVIKEISNAMKALNDELQAKGGVNPSFLFKEGQSLNTNFVVKSLGIDPSNGKELFLSHDGKIVNVWSASDYIADGTPDPKWWGNFNTTLRYKNLTFNAIFAYSVGGRTFNSTLASKIENIDPYDNADRRAYYDRWKNPGDAALFKSVKDRTITNASTRFIMDNNSLTCRTISLQYDINTPWLKQNLGLSNIEVGFNWENVFIISTIKQERGLNYPFARHFSGSLRLRF